jgi:hypothetical protein
LVVGKEEVPGLEEDGPQGLYCILASAAESSAVKSVYPNLEVIPEGSGSNAELKCGHEKVDHIHVEPK